MSELHNSPDNKLGYWFSPSESIHAPGGSCLDIFIKETPTERHFDPKKINLLVKSGENSMESLTIHHPWIFNFTYHVLPGSIEIVDRNGNKEEAYTFGGSLKIVSNETLTICSMESNAPILEINNASKIIMMFIEEIEILFAKRRAELLSKSRNYEKRLVNVDTTKLYSACINTLIDKFERSHDKDVMHINEFLDFLHVERKRLNDEELTPLMVPALEDIL